MFHFHLPHIGDNIEQFDLPYNERAIRLRVLPLYTNNQPTDLKLYMLQKFVSCNMERSNQTNLIQ